MKVGVSDFKLFTLFVFADDAFRLLFSCCFLLSLLNSYPLKLLLFVFFCCKNVPRSRLKGISVQLWQKIFPQQILRSGHLALDCVVDSLIGLKYLSFRSQDTTVLTCIDVLVRAQAKNFRVQFYQTLPNIWFHSLMFFTAGMVGKNYLPAYLKCLI